MLPFHWCWIYSFYLLYFRISEENLSASWEICVRLKSHYNIFFLIPLLRFFILCVSSDLLFMLALSFVNWIDFIYFTLAKVFFSKQQIECKAKFFVDSHETYKIDFYAFDQSNGKKSCVVSTVSVLLQFCVFFYISNNHNKQSIHNIHVYFIYSYYFFFMFFSWIFIHWFIIHSNSSKTHRKFAFIFVFVFFTFVLFVILMFILLGVPSINTFTNRVGTS